MGAEEYSHYYGELSNGLNGVSPFHLIPDWITMTGYWNVFLSRPDYLMKFWVSMFLSVTILLGQLIVAVLGGYAFSRFRFPGRDILFFIIVLLMMLPYQVTLVPNYIVLDRMGLINHYASLILPGIFSAFGVFLMRQIMVTLPNSIFDASRIDGAGYWKSLWYICLPNCKSGLAALIILNFADSWNMMEQPLVFLKDSFKYPMSLFLMNVNTSDPALGFTCGVLSVLPLLLLFLRFKDEMIQGIEYSGGK
jgi:ABC-type sugar transport system, permease component